MIAFLMAIEDEKVRSKLEELYLLYHKEMFYVAYGILKDYHEAEDIVHSAIIKLSTNLEKIQIVKCNKTRAFLVILVRNLSINIYNKRKQKKSIPIDNLIEILPEEENVTLDFQIIRLEEAEEMARRLAELEDSYADILTLKYFYEYSNSEIAELIDLTEGNVRVQLHRAKQAMKKLLLEEGGVLNEAK